LDHRSEAPFSFGVGPIEEASRYVVVAIGEDYRRDGYIIASDTADGVTSRVDLRRDVFDDDPGAALRWLDQTRPPAHTRSCLRLPPMELSPTAGGKRIPGL
jgi:hypothetical protein